MGSITAGPADPATLAYGGRVASSRRLRALITNDDGIDSPGLWALAEGARDAGFDVVVAAPHIDSSGVSASVLSVREGNATKLHPRELEALPGIPAFAVEGHPAFIVHAAGRGWLDPEPDVVLSGINLGANVGRAVLHSGTVGAALTASLHGWRGLAVSLDSGWEPPEQPHWDAVLHVLPEVLDLLLAGAEGTVLSLNVPDRPVAELRRAAGGAAGRVRRGAGPGEPPHRRRRRRVARGVRGAVDAAGARHRHRIAARRAPDDHRAGLGVRAGRGAGRSSAPRARRAG